MASGLLKNTTLKDASGKEIKASELWENGPVMVVCLRRPGCLLCREEAIHLWEEREKFESLGIKLVCVLHEWRDLEVAGFAPKYWGGDLYFDEAKDFYKTVHGGKVKRGNLLDFLNPFGRAIKNTRRAKASGKVTDHNLTGDGLTLGGLLIFKRGGEIVYSFAEQTFGDHAPFEELLEACKKV